MGFNVLSDFDTFDRFDITIINKYSSQIPEELTTLWKNYGTGTFFNGYFKVINPDVYLKIIEEFYFRGKLSIPIFITSLAEIITWEEGEYIGMVDFPHGTFHLVGKKFKHFMNNLNDQEFIDEYFDQNKYLKAITKFEKLNFDECFGHVPLLALGGKDSVETLEKCKLFEHLQLIGSIAGRIGDK